MTNANKKATTAGKAVRASRSAKAKLAPIFMPRTPPKQQQQAAKPKTAVSPSPPARLSLSQSPFFAPRPTSPKPPPAAVTAKPKETPAAAAAAAPKASPPAPRTSSFGALWAGNLPSVNDPSISVHTLILGTHPSIASLQKHQYYGHPLNAFWWIAGDCLGFRRASGRNRSGHTLQMTGDLRHGEDCIIPYEKQLASLMSHGFALWDIVKSCHRPGSLDVDIQDEIPNDIRAFCQEHPTIERIILTGGKGGCQLFKKHFREWWKTGELVPAKNHTLSHQMFRSVSKPSRKSPWETLPVPQTPQRQIECLCAISVSPAAAQYTYAQKRDFWDQHVYTPSLAIHQRINKKKKENDNGNDDEKED